MRVRRADESDVEFLVDGNARMAWETEGLTLDRDRLRAGVAAVFADVDRRDEPLVASLSGRRPLPPCCCAAFAFGFAIGSTR